MGFLDGLVRGLTGNAENKEILGMVHDEDDEMLSRDYRSTSIRNSDGNNGWYRCVKCGRSFRLSDMDADHIVPKSKGGDNSRANLQLICKHCNRSKGADTNDTQADLARRKRELKNQDKVDGKLLNIARKKGGEV